MSTHNAKVPYTHDRRSRKKMWNNLFLGLAFISPWIIGFLSLVVYPFTSSLYFSFTSYNILNEPQWIGVQNYQHLIDDARWLTSVKNTMYYVLICVPIGVVLAIALSVLYHQKMPGRTLMRTLMYVPLIVPPVATGILWLWMFKPIGGLFNTVLAWFGVQGPTWLGDTDWAKISLIIIAQWGVGGNVLLLLAALADVPRQLYEAAEIDGATIWHRFWHITLPMISPVVLFITITGLIGAFQAFTEAFIVSGGQGGPADSTLFYSLYIYQKAFRDFDMGYASALSWVLFLGILAFTGLIFRLSKKWVVYDRA